MFSQISFGILMLLVFPVHSIPGFLLSRLLILQFSNRTVLLVRLRLAASKLRCWHRLSFRFLLLVPSDGLGIDFAKFFDIGLGFWFRARTQVSDNGNSEPI